MKPLALLLFLLAFCSAIRSQHSFDPEFGNNGIVSNNFGGQARGGQVFSQSDGKLLLGGPLADSINNSTFRILRYFPDGSLDESFGSDGMLTLEHSYRGIFTVQADDKVLIADYAFFGFRLFRFLPDGEPDLSFGNSGLVNYEQEFQDTWIYAIAVQPDGKILLGGGAGFSIEQSSRFFVARLTPSGDLDPSFGQNGTVLITGPEEWYRVKSIQIQPDGKILAATAFSLSMNSGVVRLNEDGSLDTGFGTNGIASTGQEDNVPGETVLLQADGKIILYDRVNLVRFNQDGSPDTLFGNGGLVPIGYPTGGARPLQTAALIYGKPMVAFTLLNQGYDFGILRFHEDGALDESFGINGLAEADIWTDDRPQSILGLPEGKIAVAGISDGKLSMVSLLPDGMPDSAFGEEGAITVYLGGSWAVLMGIGLQSDGKAVAGGRADVGDILLARYLDDGSLDSAFGINGKVVIDLKEHHLSPQTALVLPDDKIAAAGKIDQKDFFVFRCLPDGSPDPDFGDAGLMIIPIGTLGSSCNALAFQPDGKILLGGSVNDDLAICRLLPDGSPDPSFGNAGWFFSANGLVKDLRVRTDGKIIAAGQSDDGFNLFRFLPDGSPDITFNLWGKAATGLNSINVVRFLPDGKVLAAGHYGYDPAMVRILPNGWIDSGFLFSFYYPPQPNSQFGEIEDIAIHPDGRILYTGTNPQFNSVFIGSALSNGSPDSTFFEKGFIEYTDYSGGIHSRGKAIKIQPGGKVLVGGHKSHGDYLNTLIDADFLLIRTSALSVGVSEAKPLVLDMRLAPNPASSQITLSYTLPRREIVSVFLSDAAGNTVLPLVQEETRPAGRQEEQLNLPAGLPHGVYILTVITRSGQGSIKVMI